jgi:4-alpha-glucanotransferase
VVPCKERWLERAYQQFKTAGKDRGFFEDFCSEHAFWLEDFSLFVVIKKRLAGKPWDEWPKALRDRDPGSLQTIRSECRDELEKEKFWQYLFFKQWASLKAYGNQKGIRLFGDLAIYVSFDSADVWANPQLFKLNEEKRSTFVSGVPPDYFSKTGQLWGNPVYRWDVLKETGFAWWIERLAHHLRLYDAVRIDHFRGLVAYWEVPSGEKTAIHGTWVNAPVEDFLKVLVHRFPKLPVIAEDLGLITPDVREIMNRFGIPGMKVLLFAFEEDNPQHPYLPHNYDRSFLVYTGTHDNNTARGWFETEATPEDKTRLFRYLGRKATPEDIHWALIRLAMMSVANLAILSMQDLLGLGAEARMNTPSTTQNNWQWRLSSGQITPSLSQRLREMTEIYGRGSID